MAGLCAPLPTLHPRPYGRRRTARGRCGSLLLHRSGLAPPTPCRSPGALSANCRPQDSPIRRGERSGSARATVRASRLSGAVAQVGRRGNRSFSFRFPRTPRAVSLQPDQAAAHRTWRQVADQLRASGPRSPHRTRSSASTKKVKRRTDVIEIFPNEASIVPLIGAGLRKQNDERQLQHR